MGDLLGSIGGGLIRVARGILKLARSFVVSLPTQFLDRKIDRI